MTAIDATISRRLIFAISLTAVTLVAEIICGIWSAFAGTAVGCGIWR